MAAAALARAALVALMATMLVASVTALPPCAPRVCCSASPPSTTHRLKATKLCALTAVPPALAPAPVVATCLFGAYHAGGGFGACPGAAAGHARRRRLPTSHNSAVILRARVML